MVAAVRRREMRNNQPETTQKEPVRHKLRGPGMARGPAAQDRTLPSRTAPPAVQEHPL